MSKRGNFETQVEEKDIKTQTHPIWRGVGFAMIILIPIVSYAAAEVIVQQNMKSHFFPWPYDLMARQTDFLWNGDPLLYFKVVVTITIMLILSALFTLAYFLVNSAFGAPRYGLYDVPPINAKVRKRSR
jgi:hypothetical protein